MIETRQGLTGLGRGIATKGTYGGIVSTGRPTKPTVTSWLTQTPPPSDLVKLGTGEYISQTEFESLSPAEQAYLRKFGIEAFNREQAQVAERRVQAVETFKTGEGYDLGKMIGSGYSTEKLKGYGFSEQAISEAQKYQSAVVKVQDYETLEGYNLVKAVEDNVDNDALVTLFGQETVSATRQVVVEYHSALNDLAPYKSDGGYNLGEAINAADAGKIPQKSLTIFFGVKVIEDARQAMSTPITEVVSQPVIGQEAFDSLVASGDIHPLAIYKGYDPETGQVSYIAPKTEMTMGDIEKHWSQLNPGQQQIQINGALRKNIRGHYKDYDELSEAEKKIVLSYYTESYLPMQTNDVQFYQELWQEQKANLIAVGIGMIPVVGTIYHWNKMSAPWKAVSIVMDIAIIVPMIRAAISAIKAARAPIIARAVQVVKAEASLTKQMASKLRVSYGQPVATAYTKMARAQAKYVTTLAKAEQLAVKGVTIGSESRLARSLVKLEANLRTATKTFVKRIQPVIRVDSHEISRMFTSLPDDMVRNAKAVVSGLRPVSIKALRAAVVKAESALKAAQAKHPTDPSKWADLLHELAMAEAKLYQANTGNIIKLYQKLLAARRMGQTAKAANLQIEFDQAVRNMEIEWGAGRALSRGRVATLEVKPFTPIGTGTPLKVGTRAGVSTLIAKVGLGGRILTIPKSTGKPETTITKPMTTVTPDVIREAKATPEVVTITTSVPKVSGVTDVEILNLSQIALDVAVVAITQNITGSELQQVVEEAVKTETKAATKAQVKAITKAAIKTATRLKLGLKIKVVPPIIPPRVGARRKRGEYPDGTIVWQMGELKRGGEWKIIPPPYTLRKPISSTVPPKGVKRLSGTPQETLCFIGGKLPFKDVAFDLGVVDGYIDVKSKRITFTGEGLKTDVGKRIPSLTKGITLANGSMIRQSPRRVGSRRNQSRRTPSRTVTA